MNNKIILDLAGGTGAWSRPYKEAGYDVRVITLPEYDVTKWFKAITDFGEALCFTGDNVSIIDFNDIYGILAAPPCTMFSLARTRAKKPRNFQEGMEVVKACLDIIWEVREKQKLAFWALENPMGYLRQFLGKPPLTFNPCDYGDPYYKKTDLWGYFNEPRKHAVEPRPRRTGQPDWHHNATEKPKGMSTAEYRAITPKGFADAFFKANK